VTDKVDWRCGSPGLVGGGIGKGAGEAAIALSLFFAASAIEPPLAVLVDETAGRAVREGLLAVGVLVAELVVGFIADLAGPEAIFRFGTDLLSFVVDDPKFGRLSTDDEVDFGAGDFADVLPAIDTLFTGPVVTGLLFSSVASEEGFGLSSIELVDGLDLCPVLAAVAAVTACAGLRGAVPGPGRVGGLLRLWQEVVRDVDDMAGFVAGVGAELKGRFAVVTGRFGGIPLLRGEMGFSRRVSLAW